MVLILIQMKHLIYNNNTFKLKVISPQKNYILYRRLLKL